MINFDNIRVISAAGGEAEFSCEKSEENGAFGFTLRLLEDCAVKEIILFSGEHELPAEAELYGDGYQKLSQYGGTIKEPRLTGGFHDKDHYKMPQSDDGFIFYNFMTAEFAQGAALVGASSCNRFRTELRLRGEKLTIAQCLENLFFKAGEEIKLEEMTFLTGADKNALLEEFGKRIEKNHPKKAVTEFPVGWCSWYCEGPNISERKIFKALRDIKKKLPEIRYIQIDDGFQPYMGDWLKVSKKFKRSMKEICLDIKKEGFEPAIWLAPFIASPKSRLLREHPEYFVKDESGNPLCSEKVTFPGWRDGPWYMLDGSNPAAREYIYNVVKTIYNEWGVKYFKLDANVWGALPFGVRYDKNVTAVEAYRLMMQEIWRATGEDAFILGCNAPMWPSLGLVSGMRVTGDTSRHLDAMELTAKECFPRNWMNGVLWLNDPDCLLMEGSRIPFFSKRKNEAKAKMYRFNTVYIRASGGSILSGDRISGYTHEDIARFRRLISLPKIAARFDENPDIGVTAYENTREYCIFNTSKSAKEYTIEVPKNASLTDMFSGEKIEASGEYSFSLGAEDAAWFGAEEK